MGRVTFLAVSLIVFVGAVVFLRHEEQVAQEIFSQTIAIKEQQVAVEVADTPAKQAQGLSGRPSMKENEGMLFVFSEPAVRYFWMKDMKFPLDIFWIDEQKIITGIERNVSPDSFPVTFSSAVPAQYVLELNARWAETHGVVAGDALAW